MIKYQKTLLIIIAIIFTFSLLGCSNNKKVDELEKTVTDLQKQLSDKESTTTTTTAVETTEQVTTIPETTTLKATAKGKIAFTSDRNGNKEIYIMNADGTDQVNLTNNPKYDWFPTFSPDGSKIVFLSDRDGIGEIYIVNADGTNQVNLTNSPM